MTKRSPSPSNAPMSPGWRRPSKPPVDWRKRVWTIWGALALVWFLGSTVYYALGAGGAYAVTSRPAPLLSGIECNRIVDPQGQHSCKGVAQLSRERRIMMQDREAARAISTGSAILGPPLLSFLALGLFMRYSRPSPVKADPSRGRQSSRLSASQVSR